MGGGSGGNANTYDSRVDVARYMPPQIARCGFPAYASNGDGYGRYGVGGYGSANAGYSGPAGAYANPNAPNAGYVSGPSAPRSPWSNQAPTGFVGYGSTAHWNAPSGAAGVGNAVYAPTGQSPSGAANYGNHGYEYGGYGGGDGSYGNPSSYGAIGGHAGSAPNSSSGAGAGGGEQQGAGGGYIGSGYGDANGNPGYPNAVWRSDASQARSYSIVTPPIGTNKKIIQMHKNLPLLR
ncbi:PREDICTED: heterogeneous nuclear ribonucleoprotein 1-like [Nelumbo nucifera]|uniref:Heterogeneous nuclear ribonucleoprotein 1-like n=1 Tax=Nelumbo nucifera TaxID=4432 RepID=A0A1U8Q775_NELNU|nr:PREDICTED: heterogeneous nuclear ribonucleoprotein 1-like [Nelumbo nucifera]